MQQRRIILFGGTFDPIHLGHLAVAGYARNYLRAERVILIPAGQAPHKMQRPLADAADRLEMIRRAIGNAPDMEVSECELRRPEPFNFAGRILRLAQDIGFKVWARRDWWAESSRVLVEDRLKPPFN